MIPTLFGALVLVSAPQQAPDLTALVRTTLEHCVPGQDAVEGMVEVADARWARTFRNARGCGLMAEGWTGDDGALVAAARAAAGAGGADWTGAVRELQVNESGPSMWTRLEQIEGWAPASLMVIEPPVGVAGHVEIYFDPAG